MICILFLHNLTYLANTHCNTFSSNVGNKEVLEQIADLQAIKQRKSSTGNTVLHQTGLDKPIVAVKNFIADILAPRVDDDDDDDDNIDASKASTMKKKSVDVSSVLPNEKRGYAAALVWSSEWLTPEIKEYLYPSSSPSSAGMVSKNPD